MPQAVDSILEQSFKDFELLIIDDGSTDNTSSIVEPYLEDKRVKYFSKANSGLGDTLNYGISKAGGEYLIRMDSDDICHYQRFEKLVEYMDDHPGVSACGSSVGYFKSDTIKENIYLRSFPRQHADIVAGLLKLSHVLCHPSLILRHERVLEAGKYQIKGIGEDWDFFLQLSKTGEIANIPECVYYMRMNPNSISHTKWAECMVNYKFSIYRYLNDTGVDGLSQFKKEYSLGKWSSFLIKQDTLSLELYRKGLDSYIDGSKFGYYKYLFLGAIISPTRVLNRINSIFKKMKQN